MACTLDYAAKSPRPLDLMPAGTLQPVGHASLPPEKLDYPVMDRSNTGIPAASAHGRTSPVSPGRPAIAKVRRVRLGPDPDLRPGPRC